MNERNTALDWERSVIATAVTNPSSMEEAADLLPADFTGANQIAWAEILSLHSRDGIDARALANALRGSPDFTRLSGGTDVEAYMAEVLAFRGTNMASYADMVIDRSTRRTLRRHLSLIASEADNDQKRLEEILDFAEQKILSLRRDRYDEGYTIQDLISIFVPRMEAQIEGDLQPAWAPEVQAVKDVIDYLEPEDFMTVAARPGEGKCLARGTKVIMIDGKPKPVEEIKVGDRLMGANLKPRTVLSITQGREMMYWVRQNRGIDYRVNGNHILSLKRSKNEGNKKHGEILNIAIHDLLKKSPSFLNRWKGYKVAIDFPEIPVPLEPYFLGLWLGDGTRGAPGITNTDPEVIDYLGDYAQRRRDTLHSHKLTHSITRENGYHRGRTIRGLLGKLSILKHKAIPRLYLRNSRRVRLELLAGLIDSDGCKSHNGIEITMIDKDLMHQIKYLADSLGFRTSSCNPRTVRCQNGAESIAYRITIHGDFSDCPIRIPRKQPDSTTKRVDWQMTGIRLEPDKVDDYYGFTLDGDGLFLLEDMTVTHNSSYMRFEFLKAALRGMSVGILNYENAPIEYLRYFLGILTGIDTHSLKNPRLLTASEREQIRNAVTTLGHLRIKIDTSPRTASHMIRAARKMVARQQIGLLGVDYIQLINNGSDNRANDIALTTGALRQFSLENHIPVIANAQLSREIERRSKDENGNIEPELSDLRESGAIEQDSTIVMFPRPMRSPSAHILALFPENRDGLGRVIERPRAIPTIFYVKKNRNGSTGPSDPVLWLKHNGHYRTLERGALER